MIGEAAITRRITIVCNGAALEAGIGGVQPVATANPEAIFLTAIRQVEHDKRK